MPASRGGIFRYITGGALVFIGIIILLQKLDIIDQLTWTFWPIVLILVGVFILVRGR